MNGERESKEKRNHEEAPSFSKKKGATLGDEEMEGGIHTTRQSKNRTTTKKWIIAKNKRSWVDVNKTDFL